MHYEPNWPHEVISEAACNRTTAIRLATASRRAILGRSHQTKRIPIQALLDIGGFLYERRSEGLFRDQLITRGNNPNLAKQFLITADPRMRLVLPPKVRTTKGDESITYWDDKLSPTKERFTIGHEVAHTFLFDRDKDTPTKVGWWVAAGIFDRRVEYFCDVYAAALLIPPIYVKIVASALAGHGPAIDTDTIIDHFGIPIKVLYWMVMSLSKTYWSIHHQHFLEFD